jgi:ATP-binding cassette subfamily F protein 3
LLDEPTNFLDLEARTWLEGFLQETGAGVLVVSHDRFFLDATVNEVAELYLGRLSVYPGSFSSYEQRRVRELEQIGEAYQRQQEEIARVEQFIRRFRYKATKARQVQSRIKVLERMERIETPPVRKVMHFSFPQPPHGGRLALQGEELAKSYGGRTVFAGVSLELSRAEKWALVGPNGAGKSTLMRILAGREEPDGGRIRYGSGARIGYYRPEEVESLEEAKSVEELVGSWAAPAMMPHLRSLLGAFLFRGEEVYKPVSVLSGGEKSRLALLRLLMQPANLLFLDEPTNHLDLQSKDVLLDALARYSGTVMFVSHDRDFIAALSDRVAEIGGGRLRVYPGDYSYYLWRKQQEGARVTPATQATPGRTRGEQAAEPGEAFGERTAKRIPAGAKADRAGLSASQASRLQDKAQERELRRLVREEEQLLGRLEELNEEHSRLEQVLSTEEVYRDGEQVKRIKEKIEEIRASQERLMQRWEQVDKSRRSYEA